MTVETIGLPLSEAVVVLVVPGELVDPRALDVSVVVKSDVVVEDLDVACILHRPNLPIGDAGRGGPVDRVVMHVDIAQPTVFSERISIADPAVLLPHGNCTAVPGNSDRVMGDLDDAGVSAGCAA